MAIRARVRCDAKDEHLDGTGQLRFSQVVDGKKATKFFADTSYATVHVGGLEQEAMDQFEEGKEYYMTFSPG